MVNYQKNPSQTKLASLWHNMYTRCYSNRYQERNPQYKGCSMCDIWLDDKDAFYRWVKRNLYAIEGEQVDLDKDIKCKGNKIYSPSTCLFVPHSINTEFERIMRIPKYNTKTQKYTMQVKVDGNTLNLGYYDTPDEVLQKYIIHKKAAIDAKAELYRDKMPEKVYDAILSYQINIADWDLVA